MGYLESPSFHEVIKIRFSHYEDFDDLPGQVYFMMIIDDRNISDEIDIEVPEKAFINLSLNVFPGENISDLDTTVLRHINIMCGADILPPNLGMTLLLKFCKTLSEILIKIFLITMLIPMKWKPIIISKTLV